MSFTIEPGLGELLRHLAELTDKDAEKSYHLSNINYRPRYTPIMRALEHGVSTVTDFTSALNITQGAVSQTIKLMLNDGLITRQKGTDGRQTFIKLSKKGKNLLKQIKPHWTATFSAIESLEKDIKYPLRHCLSQSVKALEKKPFHERIQHFKTIHSKSSTSTNTAPQDYFQTGGLKYAHYRPIYPNSLAESLALLVEHRNLVLDVGCGSGQLTDILSPFFHHVIGTDISNDQLHHATTNNNVVYKKEKAEQIKLDDNTVDLIVTAQAAHWFDLEKFYSEVQRIAKPGAAIALISYGVPFIEDMVNSIFQQSYWQEIHEFWPKEREHVENGYTKIDFPFTPLPFPNHFIQQEMNFDDFTGYISTWSAYAKAKKNGKKEVFDDLFFRLKAVWGEPNKSKKVTWPIAVRAGRI
ncbi:MAG: methyltransferase domain-containing protein [Gammaproteobacteria bacterium]|nr:methyltransferase domain-containing protein [Gammaproteobacteria bacterium]